MPWPRTPWTPWTPWLLSLLLTVCPVSTEEPCTALTTTVSGDSTVVTIDCDHFIIIVTCAQEATEGCSSQKLPKVQSSTLSDTSVTSITSSSSSSTSSSSSSSSSTSSSSSSSTSSTTTSSSTSSSSTSSSTSTCTDCTTSTTSSTSSTSFTLMSNSVLWINGFLTFRSQSATEPQVALAVRETFRRLVRPEEVRVSGVTATATTATAAASATTWRAAFGVGETTAAAEGAARATLQALAERVAAARAAAFTAELENQLMDAGATPGSDFLVLELSLEELESSNSDSGNAWWVLLVVFGLLALALLVLVLLRRGRLGSVGSSLATRATGPVVASALWKLEEERWELAEKVLDTKAPPVVPQQWKAQWNAADAGPETRFYDLTFGIGGKLEGIGEGRNGTFKVIGAFDVNDGSVRWREVARTGGPGVVECYGQWDGMRIDGFFTAFDVSTLPQQIGQGHFALNGRVKAPLNGAAKDAASVRFEAKAPLSELSSSEAREAREAREAESDMV